MKALGVVLIVIGVALTGAGLFLQLVLTEEEGHHDGRPPTFALDSVSGADELLVEPTADPATVEVRIERAGQPIVNYDDLHDARFHAYTVAVDLDGYAHTVHATESADGRYVVELAGTDGAQRVVTQSAPDGGPDLLELGTSGAAAGPAATPQNIATDDQWTDGDLMLSRQGLDFVLSEPWSGDDHMGAPAFLALFHEGDLAFVHAHAELVGDDRFSFAADLPGLGRYLAAVEFVQGGELVTALFRFSL